MYECNVGSKSGHIQGLYGDYIGLRRDCVVLCRAETGNI